MDKLTVKKYKHYEPYNYSPIEPGSMRLVRLLDPFAIQDASTSMLAVMADAQAR